MATQLGTRYQETLIRAVLNEHLQQEGERQKTLVFFAQTTYLRQLNTHVFLGDKMYRRYWKPEDFGHIMDTFEEENLDVDPVVLERFKVYRKELQNYAARRPESGPSRSRPRDIFNRRSVSARVDRIHGFGSDPCQVCYDETPDEPRIGPVC
jgi:hypothetical protein